MVSWTNRRHIQQPLIGVSGKKPMTGAVLPAILAQILRYSRRHMERLSKAWIFVSHSTKDIEGVRRLRNELEARGAEPLLFFLKALEDNQELRLLLRREIDKRHFFLLCDSEAARQSPWVQEEHEYARSFIDKKKKRVTTIALADAWEKQTLAIDGMLKLATAFLTYARSDRDRVRPFAELLAEHDVAVWTELLTEVGHWQATNEDALKKAAENGYLIAFLSPASLGSQWVAHEIAVFQQLAISGGRLVLVDLEPVDHLLPQTLGTLPMQRLRFHAHDATTNGRMLLKALGLD